MGEIEQEIHNHLNISNPCRSLNRIHKNDSTNKTENLGNTISITNYQRKWHRQVLEYDETGPSSRPSLPNLNSWKKLGTNIVVTSALILPT